jgi:hypothetical protein
MSEDAHHGVAYNADLAQFVSDYMDTVEERKVSSRDIAEGYIESCLVQPSNPSQEWLMHEVEALIPTINYYRGIG